MCGPGPTRARLPAETLGSPPALVQPVLIYKRKHGTPGAADRTQQPHVAPHSLWERVRLRATRTFTREKRPSPVRSPGRREVTGHTGGQSRRAGGGGS